MKSPVAVCLNMSQLTRKRDILHFRFAMFEAPFQMVVPQFFSNFDCVPSISMNFCCLAPFGDPLVNIYKKLWKISIL